MAKQRDMVPIFMGHEVPPKQKNYKLSCPMKGGVLQNNMEDLLWQEWLRKSLSKEMTFKPRPER